MFKFNVMSKQKGDIRTTLSEWWKIQLQNVQTIEKILTEFSGGYRFYESVLLDRWTRQNAYPCGVERP